MALSLRLTHSTASANGIVSRACGWRTSSLSMVLAQVVDATANAHRSTRLAMSVSETTALDVRAARLCSDVPGRNVSDRDACPVADVGVGSDARAGNPVFGVAADASCVRMKRFAPEGHYRER
jgi:hypothetical protein